MGSALFKEQSGINLPLTLHALTGPRVSLCEGKSSGKGPVPVALLFVAELDCKAIPTKAVMNWESTLS